MSNPLDNNNKNDKETMKQVISNKFLGAERDHAILQLYKHEMLEALNFNMISTDESINRKLDELSIYCKPYKEKLVHAQSLLSAVMILAPLANYLTKNNTISHDPQLMELFKCDRLLRNPLATIEAINVLTHINPEISDKHVKPFNVSTAIPSLYNDIKVLEEHVDKTIKENLDFQEIYNNTPEEFLSKSINWRESPKYDKFKEKTLNFLNKFGFNGFSVHSEIGIFRPGIHLFETFQEQLEIDIIKATKLLSIKHKAFGFNGGINLAFSLKQDAHGTYTPIYKRISMRAMSVFSCLDTSSTLIHEWGHALDNRVNINAITEQIKKNNGTNPLEITALNRFATTSQNVYGLNITDPAYQARLAIKEILNQTKYENKDEINKINHNQKQDLHEVLFSILIKEHQSMSNQDKMKLQSKEIFFAMENFIDCSPLGEQFNLISTQNFEELNKMIQNKIPQITINENPELIISSFARTLALFEVSNRTYSNRTIDYSAISEFDLFKEKLPAAITLAKTVLNKNETKFNDYFFEKIAHFAEQQQKTKQLLLQEIKNSDIYNSSIKKDVKNDKEYYSDPTEMFARILESNLFNTKTKRKMKFGSLIIDEKHHTFQKNLDIYSRPTIEEHKDFKICLQHCIANTLGKDSLADDADYHKNPDAFYKKITLKNTGYGFMMQSAKMMHSISKTMNQHTVKPINNILELSETVSEKINNLVEKVLSLIKKDNPILENVEDLSALKQQISISLKHQLTTGNNDFTTHEDLQEQKLITRINRLRDDDVNTMLVSKHITYKVLKK